MSRPHIPTPRIDLATLPPLIATSDENSFAKFTMEGRDTRILREMEDAPYFSPDLKRGFKKLREEILEGVIQPLREDAPDADFWRQLSKPYVGGSWLDVPWYWAETYFYRRILEIVRYFQIGAWHERDPFGAQKNAELKPEAAPARVQSLLQGLNATAPTGREGQEAERRVFESLLHTVLWGNRVDLSYNVEEKVGRAARIEDERANLLIDDAARVWEFLSARSIKLLAYVADNAGTELALDLAFMDWLLDTGGATTNASATGESGGANTANHSNALDGSGGANTRVRPYTEKIVLHLKPQPFYVSDAMPQDVERTLKAFDEANDETRALAKRLREHMNAKRLELRVHWFYPTPLHYFEMPDDLFELFRAADFVILKGDVNYRRLVGDAHWKPTISFEYTTRYFPTPFVALRTLKSDAIVGLTATQVEQLDRADREWRVNGKRGVAQANLKLPS